MDKKDNDYHAILKNHYKSVIEPSLEKNIRRDYLLFKIAIFSAVFMSFFMILNSHESWTFILIKLLIGGCLWSFSFLCSHVNFHIHMWTHNNTLEHRIFPFYHHYVDLNMYDTHKERYQASHIGFLCVAVFPLMFIDNFMGAGMLFAGLIDMFAHQWYHTQRAKRRAKFSFILFYFLTALEYVNVINTRKHHAVHHTHDVYHLDEVKGWMDVSWPIIGRCLDPLGDFFYHKFKDISYGGGFMFFLMYLAIFLVAFLFNPAANQELDLYLIPVYFLTIVFYFIIDFQWIKQKKQ